MMYVNWLAMYVCDVRVIFIACAMHIVHGWTDGWILTLVRA